MRGSKAKAIRRLVRSFNFDEAEEQHAARQVKQGRRYIEGFDADTYAQIYVDRLTGQRHNNVLPLKMRAVRL
jgi:hypothetical protein